MASNAGWNSIAGLPAAGRTSRAKAHHRRRRSIQGQNRTSSRYFCEKPAEKRLDLLDVRLQFADDLQLPSHRKDRLCQRLELIRGMLGAHRATQEGFPIGSGRRNADIDVEAAAQEHPPCLHRYFGRWHEHGDYWTWVGPKLVSSGLEGAV